MKTRQFGLILLCSFVLGAAGPCSRSPSGVRGFAKAIEEVTKIPVEVDTAVLDNDQCLLPQLQSFWNEFRKKSEADRATFVKELSDKYKKLIIEPTPLKSPDYTFTGVGYFLTLTGGMTNNNFLKILWGDVIPGVTLTKNENLTIRMQVAKNDYTSLEEYNFSYSSFTNTEGGDEIAVKSFRSINTVKQAEEAAKDRQKTYIGGPERLFGGIRTSPLSCANPISLKSLF
jgi:hypothetical protein